MKTAILVALALSFVLSLPGWAQVKALPTKSVTVEGTVEGIDHGRRSVYIKLSEGRFVTLDVPKTATRFDEVKIGDKVKATYDASVLVRLKPPGEAPVDTASAVTLGKQEVRPGGTTAFHRTMTVTINAIDRTTSSITFVGPKGWKYVRYVTDPAVFEQVKVGDQIDITWYTEVTLTVQ